MYLQCSVSCGGGVKNRGVTCSVEGACSLNTKPPVSESCIQQTCSLPHENAIPDVENHDKHHSFVWRTEDWGPVSLPKKYILNKSCKLFSSV